MIAREPRIAIVAVIVLAAACWIDRTPTLAANGSPTSSEAGIAIPLEAKFSLWGRSPHVETLRGLLVTRGVLDRSKLRGDKYDRDVMAAVRAFQTREGLRSTGIPRAQTLQALARAAPAGSAKAAPPRDNEPKSAAALVREPPPPATNQNRQLPASPPAVAAAPDARALPMMHSRSAALLIEAAKTYKAFVAAGGWSTLPSRARFQPGEPHELVEPLRRRLAAEDYLGKEAVQGNIYDGDLSGALRHFQRRHGLEERDAIDKPTLAALNVSAEARLRQIEASRARLLMPIFAKFDTTKGPYVVHNIAAMTLELVDKGNVEASRRTIVGKPRTPSPQLVARIFSITPNPVWTVPYSIAQNEFAPRVRKNPRYLERYDMRVERNGVAVNPATLNWKIRNYELRQKPGRRNALGLLRIDMPNAHSVYFHDTPSRHLFDRRNRYQSHGCARVQDVFGLASALLRYTDPTWSREAVMTRIKQHDGGWQPSEKIALKAAVPVAWVYLTAWAAADGKIEFRNDRYGRDSAVARR